MILAIFYFDSSGHMHGFMEFQSYHLPTIYDPLAEAGYHD